jgi:hypothetical protein
MHTDGLVCIFIMSCSLSGELYLSIFVSNNVFPSSAKLVACCCYHFSELILSRNIHSLYSSSAKTQVDYGTVADAEAEGDVDDAVADAPVDVEVSMSSLSEDEGASCPRISPSGFWSVWTFT